MNDLVEKKSIIPSAKQCTASLAAVSDALYVIGGKWKLPIIISLSEGNKRFNELQRTVSGISAKVLSNELKDLEVNGFIRRVVSPAVPSAVEYELTAYSDTLHDVMGSLSAWGVMHRDNVRKGLFQPAKNQRQ